MGNLSRKLSTYTRFLDIANITVLAYVVYGLPLVWAAIKGGPVMEQFYPVFLAHPWTVMSLFTLTFLAIYVTTKYLPSIKLPRVHLDTPGLFRLLLAAYLCVSVGALAFVLSELQVVDLVLRPLLTGAWAEATVSMNVIGGQILPLGLAPYFLLAQMSYVVAAIALSYATRRLSKVVWWVIFVLSLASFVILTRREAVLYAMLLLVSLYLKTNEHGRRRLWAIGAALFVGIMIFVGTVMMRTGAYSADSYLSSQEFYPFIYGAFLTGEELPQLSAKWFDLASDPQSWRLLLERGTLATARHYQYFNFSGGYGPTVSINYTMLKYRFVPLLALMLYIPFHKRLGSTATGGKRSTIAWYVYLSVKWFFLVRNGEFGQWVWDVLLSVALFLPLVLAERSRGSSN